VRGKDSPDEEAPGIKWAGCREEKKKRWRCRAESSARRGGCHKPTRGPSLGVKKIHGHKTMEETYGRKEPRRGLT